MDGDSSPPKFVRTEALSFFSAEEVARARAYHRPLYWVAGADVALQAGVLAALAWSGAGAALDPGSLPWWARTPAYAAIVVAASAVVRAPLALWSGFFRERRWGFSTQRFPSWAADRAKAVGVNIVLTAAALLALVGLARALCLCTSTPTTIIRIASSNRWGRPASGQTSIEAAATLLSGHARRSREGGGDTTLASQATGATCGNRVSRRRPESASLTG